MKKLLSLGATLILFALLANGCVLSGEEEPEQPEEISADTVLDDRLFEDAISAKDLQKCDEILNETKKEECKDAVESLQITDEAVAALDKSLCKDISLDRYKENCENKVQEKIDDEKRVEEYREEVKKHSEEILAIESKAKESGDADICDDIENENERGSCRYNVIMIQVLEENDPSLCDEIGQESFIEICKDRVSL